MKILIVDDEKISRKILVKKLELLGECVTAESSPKALKEFEAATQQGKPFDLVTLDVSMPDMDGKQVLQRIRKQELVNKVPKEDRVKVIMVTSRMNISTIKECITHGCNGYLAKPVTRYQLLESLGKMGFDISEALKETDKNTHSQVVAQIIQRFYKGEICLPVFPAIVREIQALLDGEAPSLEDLGKIVEKEIVISSKLISIANSPLYKGLDGVNNLNAALLRLGIQATQGVISAVAAKNFFDSNNKILKKMLEKLWMHSFATACLAKRLGEALKLKNVEDLFLMGIIHDIGKMLLMKAILDISPDLSLEDSELQVAIHEIHTTFGAVLLKKLRFSKPFIQIAEFHHWNEYSSKTDPELLIIHLADHLALEIGFGFLEFENPKADGSIPEEQRLLEKRARISSLASLKQLELDPDQVLEIGDQVAAMVQESAQSF